MRSETRGLLPKNSYAWKYHCDQQEHIALRTIHGQEIWRRRQERMRLPCRRGRYNGSGKGKVTAGISMAIPPQQLLLQRQLKKVERRHTSWVRKRISGAHGHHMSQAISMYSLLSHIDYSKPTEVKAGKWSTWASDVRQSAAWTNWDYRSSEWHSSAGDERAWKHKSYDSSEWDGSKWSAPTSRNLTQVGQAMILTKIGMRELWDMEKGGHMILPTANIRERSQPTLTQRMIWKLTHLCRWDPRPRHTIHGRLDSSGSRQTVARSGHSHHRHQLNGDLSWGMRNTTQVWLVTHPKPTRPCITLAA